ncbi:MAG: hypothetical protein WD077_04795 [Bacteroidia bacterium]
MKKSNISKKDEEAYYLYRFISAMHLENEIIDIEYGINEEEEPDFIINLIEGKKVAIEMKAISDEAFIRQSSENSLVAGGAKKMWEALHRQSLQVSMNLGPFKDRSKAIDIIINELEKQKVQDWSRSEFNQIIICAEESELPHPLYYIKATFFPQVDEGCWFVHQGRWIPDLSEKKLNCLISAINDQFYKYKMRDIYDEYWGILDEYWGILIEGKSSDHYNPLGGMFEISKEILPKNSLQCHRRFIFKSLSGKIVEF